MKNRSAIWAVLLAFVLMAAGASMAWAGARAGAKTSKDNSSSAAAAGSTQDENLHLEGEKRFRSNCARCHAAPPRFAPRMMSTIVRHMRVRATITDEDMRLILRYMTE
jgi:cytochrome c5